MDDQVLAIIAAQLEVPAEALSPETGLLTDLHINSLRLVELVCAFEEAFDLEIPEKELRRFVKIKDIVAYLDQRV